MIQMPGSSMEELQRSMDWSAPDVSQSVDRFLQSKALSLIQAYEREGNRALGVYNDKHNPTFVAQQFAYMLSYSRALPAQLPDFYDYLLTFPAAKSASIDDRFYWATVKFGLRPTLRIIHLVTMRGNPTDDVAYAIAEKQLYSRHYFDTALDLLLHPRPRQLDASRLLSDHGNGNRTVSLGRIQRRDYKKGRRGALSLQSPGRPHEYPEYTGRRSWTLTMQVEASNQGIRVLARALT
jgi:hypothetical protein